MSNDLMKRVSVKSLPKGSAWRPKKGAGLDLFLEGQSENSERIRIELEKLSHLRDPNSTSILSDLEKEFGVLTNPNLTEATRRAQLSAYVYSQPKTGSKDNLQQVLNDAGFNVQVHHNDPAVDPNLFLSMAFNMVAAGYNAYAGRADAFARISGGELVVNGEIFTQSPAYKAQANGTEMFAGNTHAVAGYHTGYNQNLITYAIPANPANWPFVFFVGGNATRDPVTGALTAIATANVDINREYDFERLILKYKPMHTWAAILINFI